ncbi:MAG: signal peptidase I [Bdellovibrionales bacterium CG10_big_fil_rev_8_21_14_0_10_45_34]|nr:MAG: signal peptidase I [Bdellovibrionales bacterium CG10_big_fil_rev_8_21_14_0_10_45_34]
MANANKDQKSDQKSKKGTWTEGFGSLVLAVGIALFIRWLFVEAYVIPSGSMLPTLLIRDHIFVNKLIYGIRVPFSKTWIAEFREPTRGEVIVFRFPIEEGTFFIKRVVGVPGDRVEYEDGKLVINGEEVEVRAPSDPDALEWVRDKDLQIGTKDDFVHFEEVLGEHPHSVLLRRGQYHQGTGGEVVIPEDKLLVMGDNRDNSNDSREWGFVPTENVLGRAMFVWLSCEETLPVLSFLCNPLTLRWNRFFDTIE